MLSADRVGAKQCPYMLGSENFAGPVGWKLSDARRFQPASMVNWLVFINPATSLTRVITTT